MPAELIESELFGHEKGAFTGAGARHRGKFEQAHRGTLFLDEIGDMPLPMQAKLLHVLESGEIERVGGDHTIPVDVCVVVATHRNLAELVRKETFRQDLYHRIYVFPLELPPLRQRPEDVTALVEHFARQVAEQNGWKPAAFAPQAMEELQKYFWPGNVRELRNMVERLLLLAANAKVDLETVRKTLPARGPALSGELPGSGSLAERVQSFEREMVFAELERNAHHITRTAQALGLERSHLYKKCQQLGIDLRALRKEE